MKRHKTKRV